MGLDVLFWILVLTWLVKTAAADVLYAVSGKPNPRYELKKQKARAAGQPVKGQPRYGTRDWAADLWSDALAAHTHRRRTKAVKAKPVDDMLDVAKVRPGPKKGEPEWLTPDPGEGDLLAKGLPLCPRCNLGLLAPLSNGESRCPVCEPEHMPASTEPAATTPTGEQPTLATVINLFRTEKEITMPNVNATEVTGLDPAINYARALIIFAGEHGAAGNEGYIGFLAQSKVTGDGLRTAHEMQEAFSLAQSAADRHARELAKQKAVQEAYDLVPDAGDKAFQQGGR